jgi:hypothetical protein
MDGAPTPNRLPSMCQPRAGSPVGSLSAAYGRVPSCLWLAIVNLFGAGFHSFVGPEQTPFHVSSQSRLLVDSLADDLYAQSTPEQASRQLFSVPVIGNPMGGHAVKIFFVEEISLRL